MFGATFLSSLLVLDIKKKKLVLLARPYIFRNTFGKYLTNELTFIGF